MKFESMPTQPEKKLTPKEINEKFAAKMSPSAQEIYNKVQMGEREVKQLAAIHDLYKELKLNSTDQLKGKISQVEQLLSGELLPKKIPAIRRLTIEAAEILQTGLVPQTEAVKLSAFVDAVDHFLAGIAKPERKLDPKENN